ncbi:MAG TPA: hypothetical protein VJ836_02275 [Candidatus Saccharimonadales bacterium]|nr:hypothetical protein [Candidatus Saccharimonadales bacterium]
MQPQAPTNRPVMDVSAPPKATAPPVSIPLLQDVPSILPATAPLDVKQAPASLPPLPTESVSRPDPKLTAAAPAESSKRPPDSTGPGTPVGMVVMTIFFMMVLAGLAVMVYITSQPR